MFQEENMDKTYARTLVVKIMILLIAVLGSVFLVSVLKSSTGAGDASKLEGHESQECLLGPVAELVEITNSITCAFHKEDRFKSYVIPYASKALEDVKRITNDTFRLTIAWHLAKEVLQLNLTNENYHIRWHNIDSAVDSIRYADECLQVAGAPEMERCKFFFDALLRVKEGFLVTMAEPPTKRTEMDKYGRGQAWAQECCKESVWRWLASTPDFLNNSVFRCMYPKLLPETQEYFKKRFKDVFGIDYIPDGAGRRLHIFGEKGTRWDGKGLKWGICDKDGNWQDFKREE